MFLEVLQQGLGIKLLGQLKNNSNVRTLSLYFLWHTVGVSHRISLEYQNKGTKYEIREHLLLDMMIVGWVGFDQI